MSGDHHLLPRFRKTRSAQTPPPERTYSETAGGDHLRLRGIPVLAHGVGGAQLGSRPEREVLRDRNVRPSG